MKRRKTKKVVISEQLERKRMEGRNHRSHNKKRIIITSSSVIVYLRKHLKVYLKNITS
jgi:hypothetical protein